MPNTLSFGRWKKSHRSFVWYFKVAGVGIKPTLQMMQNYKKWNMWYKQLSRIPVALCQLLTYKWSCSSIFYFLNNCLIISKYTYSLSNMEWQLNIHVWRVFLNEICVYNLSNYPWYLPYTHIQETNLS